MVDRNELPPQERLPLPDREPTALQKEKMLEAASIAETHAVGERARSTIERQEGEAARRHDLEDWEREMGIRCR